MKPDKKTERFMAELSTAIRIQQEALAAKGIALSVEQAHEAWAEHSDDYCAGWLCWRDENPRGEILEALTKYEARHGALKRVDLAKTRVVNPVTGKQVNKQVSHGAQPTPDSQHL